MQILKPLIIASLKIDIEWCIIWSNFLARVHLQGNLTTVFHNRI